MNASRRFYPRLRSIILEVSNKMHSFRGAFCRFCREKRHADGFGAFNFATLVFLLLARHSPQAVSARAACVGCHQKYRESRDDVAGVLYLFSAKRYPKIPGRCLRLFVPANVRNGRLFAGLQANRPRFLPLLAGPSFHGSGIGPGSFAAFGGAGVRRLFYGCLHRTGSQYPAVAPESGLKPLYAFCRAGFSSRDIGKLSTFHF